MGQPPLQLAGHGGGRVRVVGLPTPPRPRDGGSRPVGPLSRFCRVLGGAGGRDDRGQRPLVPGARDAPSSMRSGALWATSRWWPRTWARSPPTSWRCARSSGCREWRFSTSHFRPTRGRRSSPTPSSTISWSTPGPTTTTPPSAGISRTRPMKSATSVRRYTGASGARSTGT